MPWIVPNWDPGAGSSSAGGGPGEVPDPAETAWRLGAGPAGPPWDGRVVAGFDLLVGATATAQGFALAHDPADPLDASVWRGRDEAPLVAPAVAWASAPDGTFTLAIPAASTAMLDPGTYRLQVGVTAGGVRSLLHDGQLEVLEAPGSGAARTPYVTSRDLEFWYDQVAHLQSRAGSDAGFLLQRVQASDDFDRRLVTRYDPRPGFVRTRRATPDPLLGYDVPDPAATPPTPARLSAALAAGGLIVDAHARELVSKMALAGILDRQEVMGQGRNPYEARAAEFRAEVARLWAEYDIQVDTSSPPDGVADLLIGRDVILLPPGTAP